MKNTSNKSSYKLKQRYIGEPSIVGNSYTGVPAEIIAQIAFDETKCNSSSCATGVCKMW